MTLSAPFVNFPEMKTDEDPTLPSYLPSTALSLGLGLATLRAPNDIYYDCWDHPPNDIYHDFWHNTGFFRRRVDECSDPNCPLLIHATYLTEEARQKKIQGRRDTKAAELEGIMKDVLELQAEEQSKFIRKLEEEKQEFLELQAEAELKFIRKLGQEQQECRKKQRDLVDLEKNLHERELSLEQQEQLAVENESLRQIIHDMASHQHDQTLQDFQKDLPYEHALVVEDGPNAFGSPPWVPARTPTLGNTSPATSPPASLPPTSPPPIASSPPSSPVQSPFLQPEIPTHDAAKTPTYSCIKCNRPDNGLMIGCQNRKACKSRKWGQALRGIDSGRDAWFHISHLGMTEATFYKLIETNEDWYCPLCRKSINNTKPNEDTMTEPRSPRCQRPMGKPVPDKFEELKRRRQAELARKAELLRQAELSRQAETHKPKKPTTTKRRRARTPKSKESTNSEKAPKESNRRPQVLWTNPLERAALIDAMRTVIYAGDQTERRYLTASQLMLARGFDRSRWQVKNKWNRAVRDEAQRQGVPEDRHEKAGMKIITGIQDPADRKRKRRELREAEAARKRVVELGMMAWDPEKLAEKIGEATGEQDADGEADAEGEDGEADAEGEDEEGPEPKRQRSS